MASASEHQGAPDCELDELLDSKLWRWLKYEIIHSYNVQMFYLFNNATV